MEAIKHVIIESGDERRMNLLGGVGKWGGWG